MARLDLATYAAEVAEEAFIDAFTVRQVPVPRRSTRRGATGPLRSARTAVS